MTAFEYLKQLREEAFFPGSREGRMVGRPSNGELRRWLRNGSVVINGERPGPGDEIGPKVWQLVFFPGAFSQCTIIASDLEQKAAEMFRSQLTAELVFKQVCRFLIREGIHPTPTKIKERLDSGGKLNNLNGRQVNWLRGGLAVPRIKEQMGLPPPPCPWNCCTSNGRIP